VVAMTTTVDTCGDRSVATLNFGVVMKTMIILKKLKVLSGMEHISLIKFGFYVKQMLTRT
jgi:predicted regulator of Ras-like GTPase activity (Roadblock/LC7/MglB family)